CPACGRHIHLPDADMSLPSIQCARCDNHFCPATGEVSPRGQTVVALPDTTREEPASRLPQTNPDSPAPRLQPGTIIAVAIIALALVLGIVVMPKVVRQTGQVTTAEERPRPRIDEEELVKAYILNNAGESAGQVRFLTWGPHMDEAELRKLV